MKKTVFISSTYKDLKKHRKVVWDVLSKYDVIVRGMEQFGARKESPLETCISEIEQSDIYVGIIAFKLGSINAEAGKSYTQLEYERALELKKEILIYFMDETNGEVTPINIDFGGNREKLISFKSILQERHTIDFFTNENDLGDKINRKFNELLTQKNVETTEDEYEAAKNLIDLFIILPKAHSGKEVKLKIKKNGGPFSASQSLCNIFNFEYGKTLVQPVNILLPETKEKCFESLIVDYRLAERLLTIEDDQEIDVYSRLLFSTTPVSNIKANFYPSYETKIIKNPNYSSLSLGATGVGMNKYLTGFDSREYITKTEVIPGEGKIILQLKEFI